MVEIAISITNLITDQIIGTSLSIVLDRIVTIIASCNREGIMKAASHM